MATLTTFSFFPRFLLLSLCLFWGCTAGAKSETSVTIHLSSLLPSPVCTRSTHASGRKSSLEVVHKRGPCFRNGDEKSSSLSHLEILQQDQARVDSIHSKFSKISSRASDVKQTDAAVLPAKDGRVLGSPNYIVQVGLGTPKNDLSLEFDTGSDLTWTQCQPCVNKSCYQQKEPIFDPRLSSTYANISCSSTECSSLLSATGYSPNCASSTCVYRIRYGDSSFSVGFFAKETISLTSSDVFPGFLFGCGENNQGLFRGSAGLLGLGRHPISIVSQTESKFNKLFSYCLPSSPSSTGHLTFGNGGGVSKSVQFTPLSTISQGSSFYGLDITGITVAAQTLPIQPSVFTTAGAIIDSGTVITRLPPDAYSALRAAFRQQMSNYSTAPAFSILDTCYDFSNYTTITVPEIGFSFNGGVVVTIDISGLFFFISQSQVCLAFAGNSAASDLAILGNTQQKTLEVVYDTTGGRVGFGPNGCT